MPNKPTSDEYSYQETTPEPLGQVSSTSLLLEGAPAVTITYLELKEYHIFNLKKELQKKFEEGKINERTVIQTERNHLSAINGWLKDKNINPQGIVDMNIVIGDEMGVNFIQKRNRHLDFLREKNNENNGHSEDHDQTSLVQVPLSDSGVSEASKGGLEDTTLNSRSTLLGRWQRSFEALQLKRSMPVKFAEQLKFLLERNNLTICGLSTLVGMKTRTLKHWVAGDSHPSLEQLNHVTAIENYFKLPANTLNVRPIRRRECSAEETGRTSHGKRMQKARKEEYLLNEFPPKAQAEWDELYALKTAVLEPENGLKRNGRWYKDELTGECPTAERVKDQLASLYGFACEPDDGTGISGMPGKSMSECDMTLALVSVVPLVKEFLEFRRQRTPNKLFNKNAMHCIAVFRSLLRRETGFVRQHPEYGEHLSPPIPADEWNAWCDHSHNRLGELYKEIKNGGLFGEGRIVEEPIKKILALQHPLQALFRTTKAMAADTPAASAKIARALHIRDQVLIEMITANPLRIRMFSKMTYKVNKSGEHTPDSNLYKTEEGYRLRFLRGDFKNRRSLKEDYDAPLPNSLTPLIEIYLFEARPLLKGGACRGCLSGDQCEMNELCVPCDYLFRPAPSGGNHEQQPDPLRRMSPAYLSNIIYRRSRYYLRDICPGFGAHAVRHIAAHDYIKNHLNGYEVAASILHDKLETVKKDYGHVKHADFFGHWLVYLEDVKRMSGGTGELTADILLEQLQKVVVKLATICSARRILDLVRNVLSSLSLEAKVE
jgi:transcriptional regulator with XRE-family HTH domain